MYHLFELARSSTERAEPVAPMDQAQMDLAIRLMLSATLPPKIRNARYAGPSDVELRLQRFDLVHTAYMQYVTEMLAELNENMESPIETADFLGALHDFGSDVRGALEIAADKMLGN